MTFSTLVLRFGGQAVLSPIVALINGLLMALAVLLAARGGQLTVIAAYTAGVGVASLTAVLASGGSTLKYVHGDDKVRAAVVAMRRRLTAPTLLLGSLATATVYERMTALSWWPVLLGSLSVLINNQSEIRAADLQGRGAIVAWGTILVATRTCLIVAVLFGSNYAVAASAVSLITWICVSTLAARLSGRLRSSPGPLVESIRRAYSPPLLWLALMTVLVVRLPTVVVPFLFDAQAAGAVAVILTAQHSATSVIVSGLYTIMAIRANSNTSEMQRRGVGVLERTLLLSSVPLAVVAALLAPLANEVLGTNVFSDADVWWILSMLAIPFLVQNRAIQFRLTATSSREAATFISVVAVILCGWIGISLALSSERLLAASTLLAESLTLVAWAAYRMAQRGSK